ncbi:MAG: RdgB/HAM1 family non-canonical purine NTP pyrophosphatase [Bacilli bacterium]
MEYKEIVVATSNPHKMEEYSEMLSPLGFKVSSLKEYDIELNVEETGSTFEENSLIKARFISKILPNKIVLADDSGLEIKALNGFPGIYSARFMEDRPYPEKWKEIIKRLKGYSDKTANFTTVISLVNYRSKELTFEGKAFGKIVDIPQGENGFGYDPIFYSNELKKTFGVATAQEKNSVSHRSKALKKLVEYLKNN